jgi:hypothetical protein
MTIKNLIANLITKYRNHCAEVAQLRVEREEARQKLAEAKLELSCMKSDPVFADVYEGFIVAFMAWNDAGNAIQTGQLLMEQLENEEEAVILTRSR